MLKYISLFFLTFFLTVGLVHVYRRIALRYGLVDIPGRRKRHAKGTAPVGGLAIFTSFFVFFPFTGVSLKYAAPFLAGLIVLLVAGAIDDKYHLSARGKFIAQALAATIMTSWGGLAVTDFGNILATGNINLGDWSIPFTLFAVIGLINATNMSDGIDGLAGGIAASALIWLALAAAIGGMYDHLLLMILLIAAIAGFLLFNLRSWWRRHALIFLGDAGSMTLGFALAWFAVDLSQGAHRVLDPVTIIWISGLPVIDTICLITRRILKGQSPFVADRSHLHHIFLRSGFSVRQTTVILVTTSTLLGAIGIGGWLAGISDFIMFGLFVALALAYAAIGVRIDILMRVLRRLRSGRS